MAIKRRKKKALRNRKSKPAMWTIKTTGDTIYPYAACNRGVQQVRFPSMASAKNWVKGQKYLEKNEPHLRFI